VWWARQGLNL